MPKPRSLEERVARAERELLVLRVAIIALLVIGAVVIHTLRKEQRDFFVTDSLIVPHGFLFGPGPFAGIAPSKDDKDIVLWFAQHQTFAQTRMGFERNEQALTFVDARGKLRIWLGIAGDGTAKLRILDPAGKDVWTSDNPPRSGGV